MVTHRKKSSNKENHRQNGLLSTKGTDKLTINQEAIAIFWYNKCYAKIENKSSPESVNIYIEASYIITFSMTKNRMHIMKIRFEIASTDSSKTTVELRILCEKIGTLIVKCLHKI